MRTDFLHTPESVVHDAVVVAPTAPIKFDVTSAAIAEMQARAAELTIINHEDKLGFKAVYEFRQVVKRQRIAVEKRQKELKDPHTKYNREVDALAKQLTEPMDVIEDGLLKQEKWYEAENERIAHEKALFIQQRTEGRVNQLRVWGFAWNAVNEAYEAEFVVDDLPGAQLSINFDDIKELSDEEYEPTFHMARINYENHQAHLAELQRQKDEKDRIEAEARKIEQDRINAENEQLRQQVAEQQRLASEQAIELRRQADLLNAQTIKSRTDALIAVGYYQDEGVLNHPGGNEYLSDRSILAFTDLQFAGLIDETNQYHKRIIQEKIDAQAAESERIRNEKAAENERKQADKERMKLLKPDVKQLRDFFASVKVMGKYPKDLNLPESQDLYDNFFSQFGQLVLDHLKLVDAL